MDEFKLEIMTANAGKIRGRILFLVSERHASIERRIFIVGLSNSHKQLWHEYCVKNKLAESPPKLFAAGSCYDGRVEFWCGDFNRYTTDEWKQAKVLKFIAGQGLPLLVNTYESRYCMTKQVEQRLDFWGRDHEAPAAR